MPENFDPLEGMMSGLREAAIGLHEMFLSLVAAGFTEDQAIKLVAEMVKKGE